MVDREPMKRHRKENDRYLWFLESLERESKNYGLVRPGLEQLRQVSLAFKSHLRSGIVYFIQFIFEEFRCKT